MDPVRTEVMKNRFCAIVEEASTIAYRTAHTTFVKLTQDYQVALATPEGEFFAYPYQSGVTMMVGLPLATVIDEIGLDAFRPGDVIICNDPFGSEGMCTHTMDIHLLKPIFGVACESEDAPRRPVAFGWAFIHASDIGGAVPGSVDPTNTDVFQEGIRIRTSHLYRGGERNEQLIGLLHDNSRIPDLIWGDLQAMMAAIGTMEQRLHGLCERHGVGVVCESMRDVMALAELKSREVIAAIPDGEWCFGDYLEGVTESARTIFLHCRMTVAGDTVTLDFEGSDPQVPAALNFVTREAAHPFLCMALLNYIQSVEPTAPMNAGLIRPIHTRAPRGTVVNCDFPAAMGNRWVTVVRLYDTVLGCLDQALDGGPLAAGAGQGGIILSSFRNVATGLSKIAVVQPLIGGSGGRAGADGVDAVDMPFAFLRSNPIEMVEVESPLVVRRFDLLPDSMGAGKHRGGAAIVIDLEVRSIDMVFTVRGLDRFVIRPWGVNRGRPGRIGAAILNPDGEDADLGKVTVLELERGQVLRLISSSGGGYGDPLERDPDRVSTDVRRGLLSPERARSDYGVAMVDAGAGVDAGVDAGATEALRAAAKLAQTDGADTTPFDFGPEREAIEAIWPTSIRARLATRALEAPTAFRYRLLAKVRDEFTATNVAADESTMESALAKHLTDLAGTPDPPAS